MARPWQKLCNILSFYSSTITVKFSHRHVSDKIAYAETKLFDALSHKVLQNMKQTNFTENNCS